MPVHPRATPYSSPVQPGIVAQALELRLSRSDLPAKVFYSPFDPDHTEGDGLNRAAGFYLRFPTAHTHIFLGDRPRFARRRVRIMCRGKRPGLPAAVRARLLDAGLDLLEWGVGLGMKAGTAAAERELKKRR